jgi:hypothetical protein
MHATRSLDASGHRFAKLDGQSVVPLTDAEAAQSAERHRHIMGTRIGEELTVSTVFTGFNCGGYGKPDLWFQCTVLGSGDDFTRQYWRYATYQDALDGHLEVVRTVINSERRKIEGKRERGKR